MRLVAQPLNQATLDVLDLSCRSHVFTVSPHSLSIIELYTPPVKVRWRTPVYITVHQWTSHFTEGHHSTLHVTGLCRNYRKHSFLIHIRWSPVYFTVLQWSLRLFYQFLVDWRVKTQIGVHWSPLKYSELHCSSTNLNWVLTVIGCIHSLIYYILILTLTKPNLLTAALRHPNHLT